MIYNQINNLIQMSYQHQNIGLMDEGYFVPRTQILAWLNTLLNLTLTKIQQLGSGAVYCQVIDVIHPGKISLSKVNWKAKYDYEFVSNLKILQTAFDKIGIKRRVEVEKLAKAKYQDNLEFIQWLKRYYDLNCGQKGNLYNPEERRNTCVDFSFAEKNVIPKTFNGSGQVMTEKKRLSKKEDFTKPKTPRSPQGVKKMISPLETITEKTANLKHIKEEKLSNLEEKLKTIEQEKEFFREQNAKNEEKIDMVRQIMKTEDELPMKFKMIEEILKE